MLDGAGKAVGSNPAIEAGERAPYGKEQAAETRAAAARGKPPIESAERGPTPGWPKRGGVIFGWGRCLSGHSGGAFK